MEVFNLIEYDTVCFLDADCLIYKNFDKELEEHDFLFDLNNRYVPPDTEKARQDRIYGCCFIASPSHELYEKIDSPFWEDDEIAIKKIIFKEEYLIPLIRGKSIFMRYKLHLANLNPYASLIKPKYPEERKYWQ